MMHAIRILGAVLILVALAVLACCPSCSGH